MEWMREFVHRPQNLWLRRALFQVHLWTGLAVGLYATFIGLTGSVLVFREELSEWPVRHAMHVAPVAGEPSMSPGAIAERARGARPGTRLTGLILPAAQGEPYQATLSGKGGATWIALHPQSGELLASRPTQDVWLWLHQLHGSFVAGRTGRWWNGIGGAAMVLMCLTGFIIWWPGRSRWKRGLGVEWRANWKRINFDLHSATGFWLLLPIFLLSVTGAYFTWPDFFRSAVSLISPVVRNARGGPRPGSATPGSRQTFPEVALDTMIVTAERAVPGKRVSRVRFSPEPGRPVQFSLPEADAADNVRVNLISVDPREGRVLTRDLYANRTAGDHIMAWIVPLHFGNFGGLGIKIAYALFGLAFPLLFFSGFLMWWNRVVARRVAVVRRSEGEVLAEQGRAR